MMSISELSKEEVVRRLEPYDIVKNPRLAALYPTGQYPHTRRCAILVPLFFSPTDGQLHVLLTQRAASLRSHASSVAFPGGAQDPTDVNDTHTALREAQEEVGLQPSDVTVVAHLPPVFVWKCNSVFPVVGFIPSHFQPRPNPQEVAFAFSLPLKTFVENEPSVQVIDVKGLAYRTASFIHEVKGVSPVRIWGVTCNLSIMVARAVLGPSKRFRMLVKGDTGKKNSANLKTFKEDVDDSDYDDEDVFGDLELLYHVLCEASRPSGHL